MEWRLEKKATTDSGHETQYHPDTLVPITTKDAQALDRKIDEEIKEKEIKALGVLMEHIEPHSRAPWARPSWGKRLFRGETQLRFSESFRGISRQIPFRECAISLRGILKVMKPKIYWLS